jgi:hypothetical protein
MLTLINLYLDFGERKIIQNPKFYGQIIAYKVREENNRITNGLIFGYSR